MFRSENCYLVIGQAMPDTSLSHVLCLHFLQIQYISINKKINPYVGQYNNFVFNKKYKRRELQKNKFYVINNNY